MQKFFLLNFHQDDVVANLADAFPGDDEFAFPAKKSEEPAGTRDDKGGEALGFAVKLYVDGAAETAAGADVDDFLLL